MNNVRIPLNVRVLAVLVGGSLVVGIGLFIVHRFQVGHQADIFLEKAHKIKESLAAQEDLDAKLEYLKDASGAYNSYSQYHPDEYDVMVEHGLMLTEAAEEFIGAGRVHDAMGLHNRGLQHLEKVLREQPQREELRWTVVRSLHEVGRDSSAIDHIALLAAAPTNVEQLRALFDRYDLWSRATSPGDMEQSDWRDEVLAEFMLPESKTVDREKLVSWLKDDLWMVLEDAELLLLFGKCQIRLKRLELAEKPLEKAAMVGPNDLETYQVLASLLRRLGRPRDADYWMSELVSANPDSFDAVRMRGEYRAALVRGAPKAKGRILASEGLSDAIQSVCKAIEQAVDKADAAAPTTKATKDLKTAFDAALALKPRNGASPTAEFRDRLLGASEKLKVAGDTVPGLEKEVEGVRDGLVLAATCELAAAHVEGGEAAGPHLQAALAYGEKAAELYTGHAPAYLVLAEVERGMGHADKAIEWLRKGAESGEDTRPVVMWQLASSLINRGRLDEARETIRKMGKERTPDAFLAHLNAMVHYAEGNWAEAKEGFEQVLPKLSQWPQSAVQVDLLIARCCEQLGLVDQQRGALMRAAALDVTSIEALMKLADLEFESGQFDEAIEDYRRVLRLRNAPADARLSLARALLAKNLRLPKSERNWADVETAIADAEKVLPDSPRLAMVRAEVLAARNKPKEAAALLLETRKALHAKMSDLDTQRRRALEDAKTLAGEAKTNATNQAKQLGRTIRGYQGVQSSIWGALVRLAQRERNWEGAGRLIEAAAQESGDSPRVRLMKARNLVRQQGRDAAAAVKKLLEGTEDFSTAQKVWLWRNFAALAYEMRDYSMADQLCDRVLKAEPDALDVYKLLFQIAAAQKDVNAMETALSKIKEIEQKPSAFWHYGEAMRLMIMVDEGGSAKLLDRALDHLSSARQVRPKWGQVGLLAGMIHERKGDADTAIDEYVEAINLGAADPKMVQRAAALLMRNNRLREADRMFRLLAEREPLLSDEASRGRRSIKARLGEFDAALGPAREVAATSDKIEDHIWLGQLLGVVSRRMRGQNRNAEADSLLAEAEAALRHAVILKSDAPEPWVALIQFYAQSRQPTKAEKTIAQARLKLAPAVAAAALGQCYEVLDRPERAREQYEASLASAPRDPRVAENAAKFYYRTNELEKAKTQLMRIVEAKVDATKEQQMRARRQMAMIFLQQGGRENREKAVEWIGKNLAQSPDSRTDQYLRAVILADDLSGKNRQEAIASLKKLMAEPGSSGPEIQFALAQLYLADDNWREYKLRMDKLLQTHRGVPQYVAAYAGALIDRKDYYEAELKATELAKLAPGDARTVAIRSELAFRQGQYERLRRLLLDYLDAAPPAERENRMVSTAEAIERFAGRLRAKKEEKWSKTLSKEAYDIYRRYIDGQPGRELQMASFLAKQERLDEAIDLIDTLWEMSDPNQVAVACFNVVDGKGASEQQVARVDEILQRASRDHPDAMVIQIAIAVVRNIQGRFEDAEAAYRRILRDSPNNPTALNNLAVLLARHGVKLKEAAQLIDRAIEQAGPTDDLLDSRAIVQLALNHPEDALEDLRKAIATKPTALRYFHQAEAYHACGQRKAAVQAFDKAVNMGLREEHLQGVEQRKFKKLKVLLK